MPVAIHFSDYRKVCHFVSKYARHYIAGFLNGAQFIATTNTNEKRGL